MSSIKRRKPVREAISTVADSIGTTARVVSRGLKIIDLELQQAELESQVDLERLKMELATELSLSYTADYNSLFGAKDK